jgi:signal transduction histidine kinase
LKNSTSDSSERLRVARDLHDTLAQELAGVGYLCDEAISLSAMGGTRQSLIDIRNRLSELNIVLRDEIGILREEHVDFSARLKSFISQVQSQTNVEITSTFTPLFSLENSLALELYRIVRELIINIVRHSHASFINVAVRQDAHSIEVSISDDGIENLNSDVQKDFHFGSLGLQERIDSLGGKLTYRRDLEQNDYLVVIPV